MCLSQFCYLPHTACLSGWLICWKNSIGNKRERKERDSKEKKKKRKPDNQRRGKKQKSKCSPLVWSEKRWGTEWKKTTYFTTLLLFFLPWKEAEERIEIHSKEDAIDTSPALRGKGKDKKHWYWLDTKRNKFTERSIKTSE